MSDADLRRSARADPGDLSVRAGRLRARVRAGDLAPEDLAFAARLGDPAARLACPEAPERLDLETLLLHGQDRRWLRALRRLGRGPCVSGAARLAGLVRDVVARRDPEGALPPLAEADAALAALDLWTRDRAAARPALEVLADEGLPAPRLLGPRWRLARALRLAAQAALGRDREVRFEHALTRAGAWSVTAGGRPTAERALTALRAHLVDAALERPPKRTRRRRRAPRA